MPKDLSPGMISKKMTAEQNLTLSAVNEKINIDSSAFSASIVIPCDTGVGTVYYKTAAVNTHFDISPNMVNGPIDDLLAIGEIKTITAILTLGPAVYNFMNFRINGVSQSVKWSGGAAPTLAANALNVMTFSIIKTAASTYTVLGTMTKFA